MHRAQSFPADKIWGEKARSLATTTRSESKRTRGDSPWSDPKNDIAAISIAKAEKRIWKLQRTIYILIAVIILLVIGGAVGGGIGSHLAVQNALK